MRRNSLLAAIPICFVLGAMTYQCARDDRTPDVSSAEPQDFQTFNLAARSIGLLPGEIALTCDDGPGGRTLELANWLRENDIPATFFMVGREAATQIDTVRQISQMNFDDGSRSFIVANHSMTHTTPLPATDAVAEVGNADKILNPYMNANRQPFLFRAPYGDFTRGGQSMVNRLNGSGDLSKYIGPIFWNIGGELTSTYSADWACWGQNVSVDRCADGYIRETLALDGGIMLTHDIHSQTVDMLTGANVTGKNPNRRSLILELQDRGFKFVAMDKDPQKLSQYGNVPGNMFGTVYFSANSVAASRMQIRVQAPEATRLEVWIDRLNDRPLFTEDNYDGSERIYTRDFSVTGNRIVTVKGYRGSQLVALRTFTFQIRLN